MAPGQKVWPRRNTQPSNRLQTQQASSSNTKKVRGKNKSKGLERLIKKAGHPLNLNISEERRPIGENHELLSREIGLLTRYHAPLKHVGWKDLSDDDKKPLYELLKMKFNLNFDEPHVKGCVELLFSSSYKSFRHRCYTHYLSSGGGDNARNNPCEPLRGRQPEWTWLCDHFETEEFKEKMLQMQQQTEQEGEIQLTEQKICEKVLGKAYGYIRGRGHGPKPNRRASSTSGSTVQQVEEELVSTKQVVAMQQAQLETQQMQIDWLRSVVSKLAGISPPSMDDIGGSGPAHTSTTSSGGSGSLVSDGISRRSCT